MLTNGLDSEEMAYVDDGFHGLALLDLLIIIPSEEVASEASADGFWIGIVYGKNTKFHILLYVDRIAFKINLLRYV